MTILPDPLPSAPAKPVFSADAPPLAPARPPLDYATPRRRPRVWPTYVAFPAVLIGGLLGQVLAMIPLVFWMDRAQPLQPQLEAMLASPLVVALLAIPVVAAQLGAAFIPALLSPTPVRERLSILPPRLPWLLLMVASVGALAYSCAINGLYTLLRIESPALNQLGNVIGNASGFNAFLILAVVGLIGPIAEETFFRGYIQTRLVQRHGPFLGILITAAFFGFIHLDIAQSPFAFIFGIYLGIIAHRAGSIYPTIFAHCLNNTAFVLLAWSPYELGAAQWRAILIAGTLLAVGLLLPCLLIARRPVPLELSPPDPSSPPAASYPPAAPPRC